KEHTHHPMRTVSEENSAQARKSHFPAPAARSSKENPEQPINRQLRDEPDIDMAIVPVKYKFEFFELEFVFILFVYRNGK
ncbi:hypothetical protein, partial [Microvirga sp. 2TAF3]|uniref:hypothetical protein n=1 Tax=Microvirga sp. 2TAF3 TaxID=3233014 RepID=UPI003F9B104C